MAKLKKGISLWTLTVFVIFTVLSPIGALYAQESGLTDIQGHWAGQQISAWYEKGLAGGYEDGTFRPDKSITRAEFITLVNRVFGFTQQKPVNFKDVNEGDWYYEEIAKANAVGYISGYADGTMKPNNQITRQEVASILTRVLKTKLANTADIAKFADYGSIPEWSRGAINTVVNQGYMSGYPDNTFKPTRPITRAESIAVLDRAAGTLLNSPGVHGPESGKQTLLGNVTISKSGVTLKNTVITGNLYLTEGIGNGFVTLDNVKVQGTTTVSGGGPNSIIIINSELGEVVVNVPDGRNVRLVAQGDTTVAKVEAQSNAKIEENNLKGPGFEEVIIAIPQGATVELAGDFERVSVETPSAKVNVEKGSISQIILAQEAKGSQVTLGKDANVKTLSINATNVNVSGQGKIETANINAEGAKIAQEPYKVNFGKDVSSANVGGKNVEKEEPKKDTPPAGGAGGGGGGSSPGGGKGDDDEDSTEEVKAISVTGVAKVGETLTAKITPSEATVNYQWQRADAENGTYTNISGATGNTYKLVADDAGNYIKVKATGTDNYTGTVESEPVGPVLAANLSWARIDGMEVKPEDIDFSDQKLTIDDAVVDNPIFVAIKAESEADEMLKVRNVIIGEKVNEDSFDVEVVKGYVYGNKLWEKDNCPRISFDDSNKYFYYDLNQFEGKVVQVIKLTPKVADTFTIRAYLISQL